MLHKRFPFKEGLLCAITLQTRVILGASQRTRTKLGAVSDTWYGQIHFEHAVSFAACTVVNDIASYLCFDSLQMVALVSEVRHNIRHLCGEIDLIILAPTGYHVYWLG
ncbi:hypothetical protein BDR06DRAFT_668596 [Suillus hirtellus]|nr:hypothetical protein BDR06DRAFT_668596 [Suillus hirtellus]